MRRNSEPDTSNWKALSSWKSPKFIMPQTYSRNKERSIVSPEADTPHMIISEPVLVHSTLDCSSFFVDLRPVSGPHNGTPHPSPRMQPSDAFSLPSPTLTPPHDIPETPENDIDPTPRRTHTQPSNAALLHPGPGKHSPTHSTTSSLIFPGREIGKKEYFRRTLRARENCEPGYAERPSDMEWFSIWEKWDERRQRALRRLEGEGDGDGRRRTWHDDWKSEIKEEEKRREREERRLEKERKKEENRQVKEERREAEERRLEEMRRRGVLLRYTG
jgi:hypothetical protein